MYLAIPLPHRNLIRLVPIRRLIRSNPFLRMLVTRSRRHQPSLHWLHPLPSRTRNRQLFLQHLIMTRPHRPQHR